MGKWALISVSDKSGLVELANWFFAQEIGIMASGGTYKFLIDHGINCHPLEDLTGFQEILGGRVKTLHPRIYGGILSRRTDRDNQDLVTIEAPEFAAVVVNLYPFIASKNAGKDQDGLIEDIDIGGVSLIRGAAKNFIHVVPVVSPGDYAELMAKPLNSLTHEERLRWAKRAFSHVAEYDVAIAQTFQEWDHDSFGSSLFLSGQAQGTLRYGENPHQAAGFYRTSPHGFAGAELLQGKPLSYNNYADADAAWRLAESLPHQAAVAIKHQTPCGVGVGATVLEAYLKAYKADPISIFGGIVAFTHKVDKVTAEKLSEIFLEVILAPGYEPEALAVFSRKKNLRILKMPAFRPERLEIRTITGGILMQERDYARASIDEFTHIAGPNSLPEYTRDAALAWATVQAVKSNAIVIARDGATVGIGGGQTNRIDAARQAIERAGTHAKGAVLASDAFFPFGDVMEEAVTAGISLVIQPGGSVRDADSIKVAEDHQIALYFTGERHFRH